MKEPAMGLLRVLAVTMLVSAGCPREYRLRVEAKSTTGSSSGGGFRDRRPRRSGEPDRGAVSVRCGASIPSEARAPLLQ